MKKMVLAFVIGFVVMMQSKVTAQIQKGNIMVGGNISNLKHGLDDGGAFEMTINPKAAWFVRNNLAVGAYVDFSLMTAKHTRPSTSYGVGALGRYYINDPAINVLRKTRFFAEATVGIEGYNPAGGENTNGLGMSVGPGISYFITPNVGLLA